MTISLVAREATWLHQRRKRREAQRAHQKPPVEQETGEPINSAGQETAGSRNGGDEPETKRRKIDTSGESTEIKDISMGIECTDKKDTPDVKMNDSNGTQSGAKACTSQSVKNDSEDGTVHDTDSQAADRKQPPTSGDDGCDKGRVGVRGEAESVVKASTSNLDISIEDVEEYILKASLTLRKLAEVIQLEILWVDGENKQSLFQLMQFFKNKFH